MTAKKTRAKMSKTTSMSARGSGRAPLLERMDAYWRAANYLSVGPLK